jgi:nucleoside-diphosphate-sugar epimerase
LNRVHKDNKTPKRRQADEFRFRGIKPSLLESSKLVLLEGNTSETHLGLQEHQFREVRCCWLNPENFINIIQIAETVTAIILNGWRVNFASPLQDFEPVMVGTRKLVEMALASPHKHPPRFIFSSSIGVFQSSFESAQLFVAFEFMTYCRST